MKKNNNTTGAIVIGAAVCAIIGGGAYALATGSGHVVTAEVEGLLKPGAEIAVIGYCEEPQGKLTTSWGGAADMFPAADRGGLVGYVTAPDNIGPGPDEGYHTFTVTCDGQTVTERFADSGNGTAADAR